MLYATAGAAADLEFGSRVATGSERTWLTPGGADCDIPQDCLNAPLRARYIPSSFAEIVDTAALLSVPQARTGL